MVDFRRAIDDTPHGEGRDSVHFGRYLWFRKYILPPPATTLDVGCGHFQLAQGSLGDIINVSDSVIREDQKHYLKGLDANEGFVKQCNEMGFETVCCRLGMEEFPFEDNSFNTILAGEVFEHIPKEWWPLALRECFRVMKNQLLISTPWTKVANGIISEAKNFDLEAHNFEPDKEMLAEIISECLPGVQFNVETVLHTPEGCVCRGFNYAQIIKEPWW